MDHPLILFDGYCILCNGAVDFVIKHDPNRQFKFASLQSEAGKKALPQHLDPNKIPDSIVLVSNDRAYFRSTAVLKVAGGLSGLWPIFYMLLIVPVFLRDWVYNIVARYRYNWFGKRDSCRLPTAEIADRFLS